MAQTQTVGIQSPRVEGEAKVTGKAVYAADVIVPNMLFVKVLRSPLPHARIKRMNVAAALQDRGVECILTGQDLAGARIGKKIYDMPLLADGVVRYAGEKVAAVAAETEEAARQGLDLIEVEYEELQAVFDPLEAMSPAAPLLHPEVVNYAGLVHKLDQASNVVVHLTWKLGDVEAAFQQSDLVVENTFKTPIVHQAYIEPHSCIVAVKADGDAEVWACTKSPANLRDQVVKALKLSSENFLVHPCSVGGDFGGKGDHNDIALCYALSRKTGRPVKLIWDYQEELVAGNPRHSAVIRVKTGVRKPGYIVAQHIDLVFDSGAYSALRPQGILVGAQSAAGPYRVPNALIEERYVYTNKVPCGFMRAPSHVQGAFALESQMDLVARELGLDPAEFRKMNFMRDGDRTPNGHTIHHIRAEEALNKALEESGYHKAKAKNVGRGIAVGDWMSKGGESYTYLTFREDGRVVLSSAVVDVGPGAYTIMRQIVAEELKMPIDSIEVEPLPIHKVPKDTGVRGSSSTRVHGGSAFEAAKKLKEAIVNAAARAMACTADEIGLHQAGVNHLRSERRMTFAELVKAKGSPIVVQGHYSNMSEGPEASTVAQVAEVEVDPETGAVELKRLTTAHGTGTVLNPLTHQGQIDGGVVMGVGYGKTEELKYDDSGKVLTASLGDYKIPTIQDIPELKTFVMQVSEGSGPYSSMSIGETALIPTAAAIANAVQDAVGVRLKSLPITAEKVLRGINGR
jgi:CO/xanthine dehydrogenase Mo-binding subunit